MPYINASCPPFEALLRREYLYDLKRGHGETEDCAVFGVCAIEGKSPTFHVLLRNGAQIGRLPVSALCWKPCEPQPLNHLCLWNCFSDDFSVTEYDFLGNIRVKTWLRDGKSYGGSYLFTVDYTGTWGADKGGDLGWKCHHLLRLDNGNFALQPNNRTQWLEESFITRPFDVKCRPDYSTNTHLWDVESTDEWRTEDTDRMFYGYERETGQKEKAAKLGEGVRDGTSQE